EPERPWRLAHLAEVSGTSLRTLQKQFLRFVGRAPSAFLREKRFERVRRELLGGCQQLSVTEIATRSGFTHLGRAAAESRRRYGGSPSAALRRTRRVTPSIAFPLVLASSVERPTVAILPFNRIGARPSSAGAIAEEIGLALWHLHSLKVAA